MATLVSGGISGSTQYANSRKLVRLSDGTLYCIYNRSPNGAWQIYVKKSTDNGSTWTDETLLSTYTGMDTTTQAVPSIAVDSSDHLHAVWHGFATGFAKYQIWYAKFNGSTWSEPVRISDKDGMTVDHQRFPSIAVDGSDNLHIVWDGRATGFSFAQIYYAKYTGSWAEPVRISDFTDMNLYAQGKGAIAIDSNGYLHVVWHGRAEGFTTEDQIWYNKYDGSWVGSVRISDYAGMDTQPNDNPSIAVDSNDYIHVAWYGEAFGFTDFSQIWYNKYDGSWAEPVRISDYAGMNLKHQYFPSIAVDATNAVHVAWYGKATGYTLTNVLWHNKYVAAWAGPEVIQTPGEMTFPNLRWSRYPSSNRPYDGVDYVFVEASANIYWDKKDNPFTVAPTVTTQVVKDNWGTTATGQGNVTNLGIPATVTAHGHCWDTSTNPTTALSTKTDNGAASSTGAFTSAMTGLTPGTGYYVRAYATNEAGTSYGANVYFVASLDRKGYIWMEGSNFRGFDENAVEGKYIRTADVDDTPVDAETEFPISSNWAYDHLNDEDVHDAVQVNVSRLGSPDYDDVQDFINQFGNRTHIKGMVISDNFDGSLAISEGTGWCKITDDLNAEGKFFYFAGANVSSGSLTDLAVNYIYLDYNAGGAGSPGLVADITGGHFYEYDHIVLGCVFMHGNHGHIINSEWAGLDAAHRTKMRFYEESGSQRSSGLVTSDPGTPASNRNIAVTEGVIWVGLTRLTTLSFDTSAVTQGTATSTETNYLNDANASFTSNDIDKHLHNTTDATETDVVGVMSSTRLRVKDNIFTNGEGYDLFDAFDSWYTTNSGSTWVHTEGVTQIDSANYNDVTSGLTSLIAAAHYGVYWLYIDFEGSHLHMVYGQASGIEATAEIADIPSILPPVVRDFGILIAKIIVQKDQDTMTMHYPWITLFTSAAANIHDNLTGVAASTAHTAHNTADTGVHGAGGDTLATDADISEAAAALDYGLSFEGIVTTATDNQHFKVATLAGKETGFFKPNVGDPYEIYVVQADGAAPEGLHTPILAYDTADGTFTHADFITGDLAVGDIVLVMHPWLAFIKDIKADTEDIQSILGTPANFMANVSALALEATLDTHNTALTAAKAVIDAIKTIVDTPSNFMANVASLALEATLGTHDTDIKALLSTIAGYLTTEIADILTDTGTTIPGLLSTIQADLDNPSQYKADVSSLALSSVLGALNAATATGTVDNVTVAMGYLKQLVTAAIALTTAVGNIPTTAMRGTDNVVLAGPTQAQMNTGHGLLATPAQVATALNTYDAVKRSEATTDKNAIIAAIPAMVGTNNAALASAWTAALATALGNYTSTRAGYIDQLDFNLQEAIAAIPTVGEIQTEMEQNGASLLDTIRDELANGDDGLTALKTAIDAIGGGGFTHTDWKGSFSWVTLDNTTDEIDISAKFSTHLALDVRRKYSVYLDLTTVEADGSFDELYIAVKKKIDGTNYRAIDRKTVTKAQIAATAEPGIVIDIPATSENIQITMKMKTQLAGDATIYYAVVREHLE